MYVLRGSRIASNIPDVNRLRDFLRMPYLYTIPDDYTPGDEDYKDDPDYLEDERVDRELDVIANQVSDYMLSVTGLTMLGGTYEYHFNTKDISDGIVKIWDNPISSIRSIILKDPTGTVDGSLDRLEEDYCYRLNVPDGDYLMHLTVGFGGVGSDWYRNGNRFFRDEFKGIPYDYTFSNNPDGSIRARLYEVLVDHFYQNRGIVQIGTIVAKMPTSFDALAQAVSDSTPYQFYNTDLIYNTDD